MAIQLEKKFGSYDTKDSRTKEKHLCFEVCALCLSSTMEYARLYVWKNPVEARRWCVGPSGGETMKECTSARSIFEERGRECALLRAVAEP